MDRMGDVRFRHAYARLARAEDRGRAIRNMSTEDLVMALATTSTPRDPLLVNVVATELQNRVRRTHAAIESIAEGVVIVDANATISYANPTALRLLGRASHEIVGLGAEEIRLLDHAGFRIAWEDRPVRRALELGETVAKRDAMAERADGSRFPVSVLAAPIVADGEILGAVVAFRDITEEHRAAAVLGFHKQLLDALSDAVVATGMDGRIIYWNAGAERLYGWSAKEVMGRNILDVTPSESSRGEAETIMAAMRQGRSWTGVFPVRGRHGAFMAHVTNAPVYDEAGRLAGIVGISRPVAPDPAQAPVTPK